MKRLVLIVAVAVLSFSAMVIAAASSAEPEQQGPAALPGLQGPDWPSPQAPFDETPITPVESAGAPMFW